MVIQLIIISIAFQALLVPAQLYNPYESYAMPTSSVNPFIREHPSCALYTQMQQQMLDSQRSFSKRLDSIPKQENEKMLTDETDVLMTKDKSSTFTPIPASEKMDEKDFANELKTLKSQALKKTMERNPLNNYKLRRYFPYGDEFNPYMRQLPQNCYCAQSPQLPFMPQQPNFPPPLGTPIQAQTFYPSQPLQPTPILLPPQSRPPMLPPLNNCCTRCSFSCPNNMRMPQAKMFSEKTFIEKNLTTTYDCTNAKLKSIMKKASGLKMSKAKEVIQSKAEKRLNNGIFHVICSATTLEYITRSEVFCTADVLDGTCYVFQTLI